MAAKEMLAAPQAGITNKQQTTAPKPAYPLPDLPALDREEWGHKYTVDKETGEIEEVPLTLLDILYPTGEEIYVAESWIHHWLANLLEIMLRMHLAAREWLVFGNVYIHWGRPGVPPMAPDVTVAPGGRYPGEGESYYAGQHGPTPNFVLEITSRKDRDKDINRRVWDYAAVGVREYLVIDLWPDDGGPWQLSGYRLEDGPFYSKIATNADGSLTFKTIGVRFTGIERERVDLYDTITGEQLLVPDEWQNQAKAEARARAEAEARAKAEAEARAQAEARIAELEARLRQLKTKRNDQ